MKILVSYRGIPQSPGWATGDMVVKALRALGHEVYPYAKYYQQNRWVEGRPMLDDHEWDLILFMECNDGDPQYHELKITRARKIVCWLFDTSYQADQYRKLVEYFRFDHLFLANPLTIQQYKVWGYQNVNYLPYACDRELHGRPLEHPKVRDVALVGSIRDDRRALANEFNKNGMKLELIGDVFREEYIDTLASSRIVINQNPQQGRGLLNMRWFETAAAGSIIIGEAVDLAANDIFCFGEAHQYNSINGLVELCKTYLSHQETQDWLRSTTHRNAHALHTYEERCKQMLTTLFPHEKN